MTHLWTGGGGGPPWEWVELQLCRDVYHCTPDELDRQDWRRVALHLKLLGAEAEVQKMRGAAPLTR